jgi:predicted CXXCH cytochrome family protein
MDHALKLHRCGFPIFAGQSGVANAMRFLRRMMRGDVLWGGLGAATVLAASMALLGQADAKHRSEAKPARVPAQSDYIDSGVCASCHSEIAESFSKTGMGRSFGIAEVAAPRAEFNNQTVYNKASDTYYTMFGRDGKLFERRYQIGYRGERTNIVDEQIDYVIGSGNHAHTFLHRDSEGRLIELPVTWYSEGQGYWAMSPGYDRKDQEDFRRAIPAECMFCHNGYARPSSAFNHKDLEPPAFPASLPNGIDCQRCHGPGRKHVEAVRANAPGAVIRAAIVNPERLSRERQLEVCMECHLETSSSHMPNEIRRYDRAVFSYRPGQPLGDYKLIFDPVSNQRDDRFEIAHAAYRLRMSACFRKSQMTCLTCHDPHISYRASGMTQHYLKVCESCHAGVKHSVALPQGSNCLACHMPQRRADDAVHVVMTDHYIQRHKPDRDLLAPKPEIDDRPADKNGIVLYYPPQVPSTAENELYLDVAEVKDGSQGTQAIARLQAAVTKTAPAAAEFYFELAHAYFKEGRNTEAIRWYEEALRRRRVYPAASKELAVALIAEGRTAVAEQVLREASAASSADDRLHGDLGNLYLREGRIADARRSLLRALELSPALAQAENLLGLIAVRQKDREEAEKEFRAAIRDNPWLAEAHYNLGDMLSGTGDYEQAAYQFQRAIGINPEYAAAHHGYGLMLELTHSYDQALDQLEEAARLDPRDAQAHGDLADLLAARGQLAAAEAEYKIALAGDPKSADLNLSLGGVLAAQGKQAEAAEKFEMAIALEPDLYQAHLALAGVLAAEGQMAAARLHCEKATQSPDPEVRDGALKLLSHLGR